MAQIPNPVQEITGKKRKTVSGGKKVAFNKKSKSQRRTPLRMINEVQPDSKFNYTTNPKKTGEKRKSSSRRKKEEIRDDIAWK
jgi:hypothetical protein